MPQSSRLLMVFPSSMLSRATSRWTDTYLRGRMAEALVGMELGLRNWATATPDEDYGLDLLAYRKGEHMSVQVKVCGIIKATEHEISLKFLIDTAPLLDLMGDPSFVYCLVIQAPNNERLGVHFAWFKGREMYDLLTSMVHKQSKSWPSKVTLRLKTDPDGSKLYYTYYKKETRDLTMQLDIEPHGAVDPAIDGPSWEEHMKDYQDQRKEVLYLDQAVLELMARGLVPQRQSVDQGVDLTVLRPGKGPRQLCYQVKGCTKLDYKLGGYDLVFMVSIRTVKRLEGLDVNYLLLIEGMTGEGRGRFLTLPDRLMRTVFSKCRHVHRSKGKDEWVRDNYKVDIWMSKSMDELWALDARGRKWMDLTGYLEAWDKVT